MTTTVLIAGTASHVGKSTVVAGLCRLLSRRGISVAPYKAQNMSNNARVVCTSSGDWGEIGVSQYVQARAARITPTTDLNPVLLKPRGAGESQLLIHGKAEGHFDAGTYYEEKWERACQSAVESYQRLAKSHDVIVAEGAGSIAEINLHDRDLANVETAEFAGASIILVVDIERGGAFASLYGTLELMPDHLRTRVIGAIITKFRGDRTVLAPGIEEFERRTGVPILGVIPHDDPGLPAEDSVSLPKTGRIEVFGQDDGIPASEAVQIGVPRLPRISNFTDLEPLMEEPGVRVAFLPLDEALDTSDAVVLPGSKNTVDDLRSLREAGFDEQLRAFEGPIIGLCGGYQMLGERILNAGIESTQAVETVEGLGLLPIETRFSADKRVEQVTVDITGKGLLAGATGTATGYEIHMGSSEPIRPVAQPLGEQSAATDTVLGTYLHGLFHNDSIRSAIIDQVFKETEQPRPTEKAAGWDESAYEKAADLVDEHVTFDKCNFK